MSFADKLTAAQAHANSWVCLGLDTDVEKIPAALRGGVSRAEAVLAFNRAIVEATHDIVCAYKPNLAFYLANGTAGIDALVQTVAAIPRDVPVVLDAKFGDIDSSARGYAHFAFGVVGVDAVTTSPYLGADALNPFLEYADHAIFLLAHTSNPGAGDLQELNVGTEPLYQRVARWAAGLPGEVGLVVGATFPEQLHAVRLANPAATFLIPGIGAQGGSLAEAVQFGVTVQGGGPLINASRTILYASSGADFAAAARAAALKLRNEINARRVATDPRTA